MSELLLRYITWFLFYFVWCGTDEMLLLSAVGNHMEKEENAHDVANILEIHLVLSYEFIPKTLLFFISLPLQAFMFSIIFRLHA